MKKAFIVYFNDNSAVVVLATDTYACAGQLDADQLEKVTRIDMIPYPVL